MQRGHDFASRTSLNEMSPPIADQPCSLTRCLLRLLSVVEKPSSFTTANVAAKTLLQTREPAICELSVNMHMPTRDCITLLQRLDNAPKHRFG